MSKFKPNQTVLQLVVAFVLTTLAVIYTLTVLCDTLKDAGAINILFLSFGLFVLLAVNCYIGYLIIKTVKNSRDELEDS